jgi:DnaJ-class molecular chaperone
MKCPRCKGKMRIKDHEEPYASKDGMMPCPTCEGEGEVEEETLIEDGWTPIKKDGKIVGWR